MFPAPSPPRQDATLTPAVPMSRTNADQSRLHLGRLDLGRLLLRPLHDLVSSTARLGLLRLHPSTSLSSLRHYLVTDPIRLSQNRLGLLLSRSEDRRGPMPRAGRLVPSSRRCNRSVAQLFAPSL